MTQNIYDDPGFFAGYSQLGRSVQGLDGAAEWPAVRAMLPPMPGLRVLDLGCGFGWFGRWARQNRAASVLGLDVSEKMLARARDQGPADPHLTFAQADLERLDLAQLDLERPGLPPGAFDLAYSSLALHYIADLAGLLAAVRRALVPGGRLVVSMEHPIFMAPTRPGWRTDAEGRRTWPIDRYLEEGPRTTDWLAPGVVKQHRTLGTTLTLMIRQGFTLTQVEEFSPTDAQIAERPELAEERDRPMFVLVAAETAA